MFEYDDWEGEFPLPENIFKWDVDMIRWLAKKFQVDADNQSADPSGDNQHEIMEIPFQLWGYTGLQSGGTEIGANGGLVSPVYQIYIDGSNANMITNFTDIIFADRDYQYINDRTYQLAFEKFSGYDLQFPPTAPTDYFYLHFNYPETRPLYFGNSGDSNYSNALYTYTDGGLYNYQCFSNALKTYNVTYGYDNYTTGSYLNLNLITLHKSSVVNGFQTYTDWFHNNAYNDTLSYRHAYIEVATDFSLFTIGMSDGQGATNFNNTITNVYNTTNQQTTTYTTENGDTINIYQGDNNISINNHGNGLTYDDLFNIFNDTILPFVNTNQGTDITFPSYDDIKYKDMGSFYITPVKQIPALPDAPDVADVSIDVSDYVKILGGSVTKLTNIFGGIGLDLMLVFTFLSCLVIRHLKR